MNKQRRRLLRAGLLGCAASAAGLPSARAWQQGPGSRKALRILVLGGTGFIGPHMVREALRRHHTVELFNRGRTNNNLFPDLLTLTGDRNNGLDALRGGSWDVVIDNSGYVPRHVADSARLLAPAATHYIYVSSISAYADLGGPVDEDSPLAKLADDTIEEVTSDTYGPLKALCEKRAAAEFGAGRLAVLRPTYICGPGDHTDRYTYWPVRTARGGEMLWPGTPDDLLQIIDVRDLANFVVDLAERRVNGVYNTVTPPGAFTMGRLLADVRAVTGADMTPVWVDHSFFESQDAVAGGRFPIWFPPQPELAYAARVSGERAYAQGLANRPTRETARDTLRWWRSLPADRTASLRAGPGPQQESELLASFKKRQSVESAP